MPTNNKRIRAAEPEPITPECPAERTPYSAGAYAGAMLASILIHRQDLATSLVEWYRGFCDGAQLPRNPEAERVISQHAASREGAVNAGFVVACQTGRGDL